MKHFAEMIGYAMKAPSGHNTQPWKFSLSDNSIDIYPDFTRSLPVVDANHRELYISLGAAAENLCTAAHELGYYGDVRTLTDGNGEYYIHIELEKVEKTYSDSLFEQITKRQTNRKVYTGRKLADGTLKVLKGVLLENDTHTYFYRNGDEEFNLLKEFVSRGNEAQMTDNDFKTELTSWIRLNKKQVELNRDGLTYDVMGSPSVPQWIGKPIMKYMLTPNTQNKWDIKKMDSSSHLVLFTTSNNTPLGWITLGRSLERFLLETTILGVANAYLNQPCEVKPLAEEMQSKLSINGEHPMLLVRIGYAPSMPYSPRKEISEIIIMQN